jgi:cation:H+ antiporter
METALLILRCLALLALGGEAVVRGAVGLARTFGVSERLIGMTLVAFGASTPELHIAEGKSHDPVPSPIW